MHGTRYRYIQYKCRCTECTDANRVWHVELRAKLSARLAENPNRAPHGVTSTYTNYGCRCAPCAAANALRCKEWMAERKARGWQRPSRAKAAS
jgi:hypothetical protein